MSRVFDAFLFYNELDLLELRLRELYDDVDFFVITEVDKTFSGKNKPFTYHLNKERFAEFQDKIIYNPIITDDIANYKLKYKYTDMNLGLDYKHQGRLPKELPISVKREIDHRDSCIVAITKFAEPEDIILLSDVDEIPNVLVIRQLRKRPIFETSYLEMKHYMYRLNCRVQSTWFGTVAFNFTAIQQNSLDNLRYASCDPANVPGTPIANGGWHLSYMGGEKAIEEKLDALAWQGIRAYLAKVFNFIGIKKFGSSILGREDILMQGRRFIDDSEDIVDWPNALRKYPELIRKINGSSK